MTTLKNRTSLVAASGAALLAVTLLAGCSGGGDVQAFCDDMEAADEAMSADGAAEGDLASVYEDAVAQMKKIDPPSEIADDWKVVMDANVKYMDQIKDLDLTDPEAQAEMGSLGQDLLTDEFSEATDNITAFGEENCEA